MRANQEANVANMLGRLFEPYRLGSLTLPNRIAMAPMTRYMSPNGIPGDDVAAYYRRRALGGVGLIFTEGTWIPHPGSADVNTVPRFYGPDALLAWKKVADDVHAAGGLIMPQLWHVGLTVKAEANWRPANRAEGMLRPDQVGPSGIVSKVGAPLVEAGKPMTLRQVDDVIESFAVAARSAYELGFDGIALHGGHGYIIDQFFWHKTNKRHDKYGKDIKSRGRFAAEIVAACKAATASDFPVVLRFSQWKQVDYDARLVTSPGELATLLEPIVDAGADAFDCSQRRFWIPEFEGSDLNLAGWTKKITGRTAITVGSVGLEKDLFESFSGEASPTANLDRLLRMLDQDEFDIVAVGRALLGDPNWLMKVRTGDFDMIKPFTSDALKILH
jgi:2,4-dienoyl-CoA reductase-like NADH-dependent reductase (Old Yellow Enzyme family)